MGWRQLSSSLCACRKKLKLAVQPLRQKCILFKKNKDDKSIQDNLIFRYIMCWYSK